MEKNEKVGLWYWIVGIWLVLTIASAHSASIDSARVDLSVSKKALMPFLVGKLESPDALSAKPLSKPLDQMVVDYRGLPDGSDVIMNRLVSQALAKRYPDSMIAFDTVTETYEKIMHDPTLDTPRKLAVRLGEKVDADIILVGTIWRFRQKGTLEGVPDSPSSVGFALYLVDVKNGMRLWRGSFDGTQKALTEDVLGGVKQIGMGLRWLTAEELAQHGIKSLLLKLSTEMSSKPSAKQKSSLN